MIIVVFYYYVGKKKQHLLASLRKTERNIFVPSGLVTGVFEELPKNRRLHILYKDGSLQKEDTASIAKEMFVEAYQHSTTHNHETKKLIDAIHNNPKITQAELAVLQGYSLSKIKRQIAELQSKGLLERIGGRKLGSWKILDGLELLD